MTRESEFKAKLTLKLSSGLT